MCGGGERGRGVEDLELLKVLSGIGLSILLCANIVILVWCS